MILGLTGSLDREAVRKKTCKKVSWPNARHLHLTPALSQRSNVTLNELQIEEWLTC